MSLIIETTDDFIRALRGNEEFKAAARHELLTQDLLELPKEFREFKTSTEEPSMGSTNVSTASTNTSIASRGT